MRAILYTRVSTQRQAVDGVSLDVQAARLRAYATAKGIDEVELVTDSGISGGKVGRPGFQRVMRAVERREVDAVCVYSLSRFARNTIATVEAVELMNKRGVSFHSLTEQLDTTSAVGRFFLTTLAALAQLEREQIGERTRSVLQFKREAGECVGQVPFGFRRDGDRLVSDEDEQRVIGVIRKLRGEGYTYQSIADHLTRRQIVNKAGRVSWTRQAVCRIARAA